MKNKVTKALLMAFLLIGSTLAHAKHILVYGDSLSAAYGMNLDKGWVSLLDKALGEHYAVTNASISGETTSGGLNRLPLTLTETKPDVVVLELGANDGLNGLPITTISANLKKMIELIQASQAQVIIAGISLPPSYGPRYIDQFRTIFTDLAAEYKIPFIDFFDQKLFLTQGYIQNDGIHPTELAQPIIKDRLFAFFEQQGIIN